MAISLVLILELILNLTMATLRIHSSSRDCYIQPGDILIGGLVSVRQHEGLRSSCGENVVPMYLWKAEAIRFVIDKINADPDILPDLTLGFVLLDSCVHQSGFVRNSLYFLPDEDTEYNIDHDITCSQGLSHFKVAAVVGAAFSSVAVKIAPLMGLAEIPYFSTTATSDELSDNERYGYHMRPVAPDIYQTNAILTFLDTFNWTYFGLLYSEGSYGESAAKAIERNAKKIKLCVAVSEIIYSLSKNEENNVNNVRSALHALINDGRLRAVVLFLNPATATILWSLITPDLQGRFVWIGADAVVHSDLGSVCDGIFLINFAGDSPHDLISYFSTLSPSNNKDDHWLQLAWESHFNCSWQNTTCREVPCSQTTPCSQFENITLGDFLQSGSMGRIPQTMDAVKTIAYGLDSYYREHCDNTSSYNRYDSTCIVDGETYLSYLKAVEFNGSSGEIRYNENGDNAAQYVITQYSRNGEVIPIAVWKQDTGFTSLYRDNINWTAFQNFANETRGFPDSVCSYPCTPRHYYIYKQVTCCWECRECRDNEVIEDGKTCRKCPDNSWPDEAATICGPIVPMYASWDTTVGAAITAAAGVGIALACLVTVALAIHRSTKIVKASSRELMAVIMCGIYLALFTVLVILSRPSDASCYTSQFGFMVSVTLIYGPLMIKTTRVYRIFEAGKRGVRELVFISSRAQFAFTIGIIIIQVLCRPIIKKSRVVNR